MGSSQDDTSKLLHVRNFVGGEFVAPCGGEYLDSYDPSTGQVWARIPDSDEKDIESAVEAALKAFDSWSAQTSQKRSALLMKVADILESRLEEFAELESRDQGKPVWLAKAVDIPRAVHNFRYFATYILHDLNRSRIQEPTGAVQYTIKEPIGVAGLISPWNLPLYLLSFKLAPALATGNTVVAKPSEMTSVTAYKLCEIFQEAGLPAGVVNLVFGYGGKAGASLVSHPKVPLVSFTGGTVTAENIRRAAVAQCKKFSLELGGKNAAVIFDDADLDKCVSTCIRSSFLNQGEICLCTSRIFVQRGVYQTFLDRFVEEAKKLKVGDPMEDVFMGAVISKTHLNKIKGAVEDARKEGARIFSRPEELMEQLPRHCQGGYFHFPTIITDVADSSAAMQEEIFGPVTCVVPFDTEEECIVSNSLEFDGVSMWFELSVQKQLSVDYVHAVVKRANDIKYGLCASVWTRDLSTGHRMSKHLKVGTVWVNCWLVRDLNMPFGGVKESGVGREGGQDSTEFFTQEKTVCVQL